MILRSFTFVETASVIGIGACLVVIAHTLGFEFISCDCPVNTHAWFSLILSTMGISFFVLQIAMRKTKGFWSQTRNCISLIALITSILLTGAMSINEQWCTLCIIVHTCVALIFVRYLLLQSRTTKILATVSLTATATLFVAIHLDRTTQLILQDRISRVYDLVTLHNTAEPYKGLPIGSIVMEKKVPRTGTVIFWPENCTECQLSTVRTVISRSQRPKWLFTLKTDETIRAVTADLDGVAVVDKKLFQSFLVPLRGSPVVYVLNQGKVQKAAFASGF